MSTPQLTTRQITFHGHVQGVFFRKTAATFAKDLPVCGYVKNLASGSVEMVAQGSPDAVAELLARIMSHFRSNITDCDSVQRPNDEIYAKFEIQY
ncbi:MAG: acylphosphatase [Planctomycetales bacterium]